MTLARNVYTLTEVLPRREAYGLADQMRRASVSIASNVAEGYGRLTDLQFRHFLGNARGSLYEMQTQAELAIDLGYLDKEKGGELMAQGWEVARILNGLLSSLRSPSLNSDTSSANAANSANSANSASSASSANSASEGH